MLLPKITAGYGVYLVNFRSVQHSPNGQFSIGANIRQEVIKTNQPKARVHVVKEGVALMTPGIFQDYAVFKEGDSSNWPDIQKKVLKKNCHVRDGQGLNVVKYQVTGASKSTTVNAILFEDVSIVFAAGSAPASNPHLQKAT